MAGDASSPVPPPDAFEEASLKAWLSRWASRLEDSLKSYRAATDREPCGEADLTSLIEAMEQRVELRLACHVDQLAERLAHMQQEHADRVERLLRVDCKDLAEWCEQNSPDPAEHAGTRTIEREPREVCKEASVHRALENTQAPDPAGANAGGMQGKSLNRGCSRFEDKGPGELQDDGIVHTGSDVRALTFALGWEEEDSVASQVRHPPLALSRRSMRLRRILEPKGLSNNGHWYLRLLSTTLVALNTIFMGVYAQVGLSRIQADQHIPGFLDYLDVTFTILFAVELSARLYIERLSFVTGANARWNAFDSFLTLAALLEYMLVTLDISFLRSLRAFRALRAARAIRIVDFFRDLRLMAASILCSLSSLIWGICLLTFVVYLFSLVVMESIRVTAQDTGEMPNEHLLELYGTLGSSMYSLFCAISGGADWADLELPLDSLWGGFRVLFVGFVVFVTFGVLNILTAIFVESAKRVAEIDRDLVIQDQIKEDESTLNDLRRIFQNADEDGDGKLTQEELEKVLKDKRSAQRLRVLDLDASEVKGLFQLVDVDDRGMVNIDEFVFQLVRLKGGAKQLDVQTMLYENKRIILRLTAMMRFMENHLGSIERVLDLRDFDGCVTMHQLLEEEAQTQNCNARMASY